ncbi:dihydrofolate reductase [Ihubacter sp. rT4E-8]|uniref:dihydrofolate reductase n=1 Tax=Ihubacter sp. rT4E-8 TaxID=3242369 RepID=UPI003CF8B258
MKLILAADENWAIGYKGGLLCHLPGDLKYFKERTEGKTVIMGRPTLESLPGAKPLPKRENIVLTGNTDYTAEGAAIAHSEKELDEILAGKNTDDVFIIGGGKVYREFLNWCDTCYVTKIFDKFLADTWFVNLDEMKDFSIVWQSEVQEEKGIRYQFLEYRRI